MEEVLRIRWKPAKNPLEETEKISQTEGLRMEVPIRQGAQALGEPYVSARKNQFLPAGNAVGRGGGPRGIVSIPANGRQGLVVMEEEDRILHCSKRFVLGICLRGKEKNSRTYDAPGLRAEVKQENNHGQKRKEGKRWKRIKCEW
jgi:hypothetical protein